MTFSLLPLHCHLRMLHRKVVRMKKLLMTGLLLAFIIPVTVHSDDLLQYQLSQQQIRANIQAVSAQLTELLDESSRNHIAADDVAVVRAVHSILSRLSNEQMARIIALLQQARERMTDPTRRQYIVDAYGIQKEIIQQFRQLLLEYQRQQALLELSSRLKELATRQAANQREAAALAEWQKNNPGKVLSDSQRTSLEIQHTEQQAIRNEVPPLLARLDSIANGPRTVGTERAAEAQKTANNSGLLAALESAIDQLTQTKLRAAAEQEKHAQDIFQKMAQQLDSTQPKTSTNPIAQAKALQQAAVELQKKEADLLRETLTHPAAAQEQRAKQADIQTQTDTLREQVESVNPAAAGQLAEAAQQMQAAQIALAQKPPSQAAPRAESAATAALAKAATELGQQANQLEQAQKALDALEAANNQLKDLMLAQQQLNTQSAPSASAQSQLAQQAGKTQPSVASASQPAGQSLEQAQQHMEQAAQSLEKGDPVVARPEQQAALDAMFAAQAALNQQMNELQSQLGKPTGMDLKSLAQAAEQVAQAQQQAQNSQYDQAAQTAGKTATTPNLPQDAQSALQEANAALSAAAAAKPSTEPESNKPSKPSSGAGGPPGAGSTSNDDSKQPSPVAAPAAPGNKPGGPGVPSPAQQGQDALARAQASLAMAMAGMGGSAPGAQPGMGSPGAPGAGQTGTGMSQLPSQQSPSSGGGGSGNLGPPVAGTVTPPTTTGGGQFLGLPPRDRDAIRQSQAEKYPAEYAPLIEQYMRNLAEERKP